jgi:hypothetical protein
MNSLLLSQHSSDTRSQSYYYDPLALHQSIRVLKLLPGLPNAPMVCSLIEVSLQDSPDYEAVSYTWGDNTYVDTMTCDGKALGIAANIRDALQRFRSANEVRTLWVDAICINQNDDIEKSQQVGIMGLIYWKAKLVNIWLGNEEDPRETAAIEFMRVKGERFRNTPQPFQQMSSSEVSDEPQDREHWDLVRCFFNRPWFTRVWTVQELGLASDAKFYCGEATITRSDLANFVLHLKYEAETIIRLYRINTAHISMCWNYRIRTRRNRGLPHDPSCEEDFLQMLDWAHGLECTNPKDAVYAFLGHPSALKKHRLDSDPYITYTTTFRERTALIQPNYDERFELKELYRQVAYTALQTWDFGPELFRYVKHNEETIEEEYPSWIPRWNLPSEPSSFHRPNKNYYNASGDLKLPKPELRLAGGLLTHLQVKALPLDTVELVHVIPAFAVYHTIDRTHDNFFSMTDVQCNPVEHLRSVYLNFRSKLMNGNNGEMDFAVTLTAGVTPGTLSEIASDPELHYEDYCSYRLAKSDIWGPKLEPDVRCHLQKYSGNADRFGDEVSIKLPGRAFFFTENGRLGLGPRIIRPGDECCILRGAKMPCVLRPVREGVGKLLGEVYYHGQMKGGIIEVTTEEDWADIILC